MSYEIERLQGDVAQILHENAGFGSGRLVAENLVLTAAHTLWNSDGNGPFLEGWQARLTRDRTKYKWPFRHGNRVVWHHRQLDLALIKLQTPEGGPLRPGLRLRIATVLRSNAHPIEAQGYPRASKEADGPRVLTRAWGRLTAGQQDRPLRLGVDTCDLPNDPHADWPGMSGSVVLLREGRDPSEIWVYGVIQEVPENFNGQLTVARLAEAWRDPNFRALLVEAGVADKDSEDPSPDEIAGANASIGLLPELARNVPAVAEATSSCKEAIESTYRHVDKLELLKMVHDELHNIEFGVLRPLEAQKGVGRGVRPFAIGFTEKKRNIEEGMDGREMPASLRDELTDQLQWATEAFQAVTNTPTDDNYRAVCSDLNGLLTKIAPRLDDAIAQTATELRLGHLVEHMRMVREKLPSRASGQDPEWQRKVDEFIHGIDQLAQLRDELTRHALEHQRLQRLDSELRTACKGGPIPRSLASQWQRIKRVRSNLTPPFSARLEDGLAMLQEEESSIESALAKRDEQGAMDGLEQYFGSVAELFRGADRRFKQFTLGLSRLKPSLKLVLDSI
jgi:hypothetical protein